MDSDAKNDPMEPILFIFFFIFNFYDTSGTAQSQNTKKHILLFDHRFA